MTLQWRHNERDGVSNHQRIHCLLNRLFRRRSKKTSKLRVTGLCAGNSPVTGELSAHKASNAENVSMNNFRAHQSSTWRPISRIYIKISYVKGIIGKDFANIKCPETCFHHNFNSQFKSDDNTFPKLHIFCRNTCNAFTVIPKLQLYPWW